MQSHRVGVGVPNPGWLLVCSRPLSRGSFFNLLTVMAKTVATNCGMRCFALFPLNHCAQLPWFCRLHRTHYRWCILRLLCRSSIWSRVFSDVQKMRGCIFVVCRISGARQLRRWCACSILLSLSTVAKAPAAALGLNAVVVVYPLDSCSSRLPAPPVLGGTLNNAIDNR